MLRTAVATAATLLALVAVAPPAQADTNADMTQALSSVNGTKGWLVKRLSSTGGTTVAAKNSSVVFEPASTIKFLHHFTATLKIQVDPALTNALTQPWITTASSSCPVVDTSPGILFGDPLQTAMSKMMWASDNGRTEAVKQFVGEAALNDMAQALGASNTLVQHRLGCGTEALAKPNKLTLVDASKLYRAGFTGSLLTASSRQFMWDRMPSNHPLFTQTAKQVAQDTFGKPVPAQFSAGLKSAYKAGGYDLCTSPGNCKSYVSIAGYAEIPVKSIYGLAVPRRYTFGLFMHATTSSDPAINAASEDAVRGLLREEISKGLDSWI